MHFSLRLDVPIDEFLEIAQRSNCAVVVKREELHHHDATDVACRIDPELSIENAGPAQAPRAPELLVLFVLRRDLKTESEFVVAGAQRKRLGSEWVGSGLLLDEDRSDVVFAHHANGALG